MRLLMLILGFLLPACATAGGSVFSGVTTVPVFLSPEDAFVFSMSDADAERASVKWKIADGYYLYRDRIHLSGDSGPIDIQLPGGMPHHDEFYGDVEIFRGELVLEIPAKAAGRIEVTWQGCADAGLCYPVQSQVITVTGIPEQQAMDTSVADDLAIADQLENKSLFFSLAAFFGLGLLLAFTPCSLPMLPILASIVVGSKVGVRGALTLSSVYVVCMALVYASLGVAAGALGENLQAALQHPWVIALFAGLLVVLALAMFGLFELQLPASFRDRVERLGANKQGGTIGGAAMLGVLSGLLVGPCMTAPLAGALLFISNNGSMVEGGLVLFSLGLGMGIPLLIVVSVGNRLLPKPGAWMEKVKVFFGFLLLATAAFLLRPVLDPSLWMVALGVLSIVFGVWLITLNLGAVNHIITRGIAGGVIFVGLMLLTAAALDMGPLSNPLAAGEAGQGRTTVTSFTVVTDPGQLDEALAQASARGELSLVDVYADWCVACKVMDREVFSDREVIRQLKGVSLIKVDITQNNADSKELTRRLQVLGPPTQVWIKPNGDEARHARITGEANVEVFMEKLSVARAQQ